MIILYRSVLSAMSVVLFASPAAGQIKAPPRHDTRSETGVSYRDGAFNWSEQDLSIGGDDGISFNRTYISSSSDGFAPGWLYSTFSIIRVDEVPLDPELMQPPPQNKRWVFHVVFGGGSYAFTGGAKNVQTGAPIRGGTYRPLEDNGTSLVYNGTSTSGYFTFTGGDGTVVNFTNWVNGKISDLTKPDGTRLDYSYGNGMSVFSNRGYALIIEGKTKACVVNLAYTYLAPGASICPADAQSVTYGYSPGTFNTFAQLLTSAVKAGATTTYEYVGADHLGCIKAPGQSVCKISNQYGVCPEDPYDPSTRIPRRYRDPVLSQQTATGETFSYTYAGGDYLQMCDYTNSYSNTANVWPISPGDTTMTTNTGAQTRVLTTTGGLPYSIRDPLNRVSAAEYTGNGFVETELTQLVWSRQPEANEVQLAYDLRGNISAKIEKAKPGSGLADIVTSAAYPATCSSPKTCNKPLSVTDARSNTTAYTYDANHGGVLTETGPAVNGVQPVKRYAYAQYYAWLKTSGGGFAPAATPVWLLTEERSCRATSTVGNACAGGSADETVVTYEYQAGNGSTPSNLLLRGKVVSADGQSLRTCYGYDLAGNRISETTPRAGLGSCQ